MTALARRARAGLLAALAALAGCGGAAPAWPPLPADGAAAQAERAAAARDALQGRLGAELMAALAAQGPAAAIAVCRDRAPALAAAVAAEHGVRIGRTAARRRNPGNAPPAWAAAHVAAGLAAPARFQGPDGALGWLAPIPMQPVCAQCHGQPTEIAAATAAALQRDYPADQATGFRTGELRGWFWVEVPPAR